MLLPARDALPALQLPPALARAVPHLAGAFPDYALVPTGPPSPVGPGGAPLLAWPGLTAPLGPGIAGWSLSEGLFPAPRFGRRWAPVAVAGGPPRATPDPLPPALLPDLLREARVGGPAGLPDPLAEPGPGPPDLPRGACVLVLDPCDPAHSAAAAAQLARARTLAGGRPLRIAETPGAPPGARPVLPATAAEALPGRLAPWSLLDAAQLVFALPSDPMATLAGLAGLAPPGASASPEVLAAGLLATTRFADPFGTTPAGPAGAPAWGMAEAIRQLADWRRAEAANRRIIACTGIEWFKHRRIAAGLASGLGPPRITARGSAAIRAARRAGGAVGVWASVMPPGLPARCAAAGVGLVRIEDGFIRSAGLGVLLAPAASLVLDEGGMHYDPASASALVALLAAAEFPPAELARAARLRAALLAGNVTKYNLGGAPPRLAAPAGARIILVPGQVEDDAALRQGGGAIRRNLDLLRAVRAAEPGAHILYKPHPDVEAGMRRGAIPPATARRWADQVLERVPIGALYGQVQAVHTMGSLSGFEALLRGLQVVTYGRPFYAGWGLTEDRDPPPGRRRQRSLDELVAAALLRYPRYIDPLTGLPCPPEVLLARLAAPPPPTAAAPRAGLAARLDGLRLPRLSGMVGQ